ncbi:MAG: hypothetical protein ACRD1G_00960, partial [Acidimicrobiales bacterium]
MVTWIDAVILCRSPSDRRMLIGEMLIQDFVQIAVDFDEIRARVRADPRAIIAESAGAAYRHGERLSLRLTPLFGIPRLGKSIDVDLAEPYE